MSLLQSSLGFLLLAALLGGWVTGIAYAADTVPPSATADSPAVDSARAGDPALTPAASPQQTPAAGAVRWRADWVEAEIAVHPDSIRYSLPRGWIDAGSMELTRKDAADPPLLRGVDFLLDPRRGTVRFLRSWPVGTRFEVRYRSFPLDIATEYRRYRPYLADSSLVSTTTALPEIAAANPAAKLRLSGSKTFSVEVGSQRDLSLEQSLDLTVQGTIGRDVDVRAVLTDRDAPLQPEGTSTTLDDLDRILVEVRGPRAEMTLGDFAVALPQSEFAPYRRQLQGVEGRVRPDPLRFFAVGASSPGEFRSLEFEGEEGKQGPYQLGDLRVPIVAGSETVWLEQRRLTRGEDQDYVIDYADGTMTFTSRHPITAYSRIAVDFQLATESYPTSVYGSSAEWGQLDAPGGTGLRTTWLTERDDRHDPLGAPLSEAQKAALRDAGDTPSEALRSGVELVGPGNGEYDAVFVDTLAAPFFVWTGPDSGSYLVRFESVKAGDGDYADTTAVDGTEYFVFAGRGRGDYLPGREVPRPESTSLLSFVSAARPISSLLLRSEVALSDHDANTFSDRDDGNNQGAAIFLSAITDPLPTRVGGVEVETKFRQVEARFTPLDRLDPSYFALDWNVDPARLASGDRRAGVETRLRGATGRLGLALEHLDNRSDFDARRGRLELDAKRNGVGIVLRSLRTRSDDRAESLSVSGMRAKDALSTSWIGSWTRTALRYGFESTAKGDGEARTGERWREGGFELGTGTRFAAVRAGVDVTHRETEAIEGSRTPLRDTGRTASFDAAWQGAEGRTVEARFTRRSLEPHDARPLIRSDLGQVRWAIRGVHGAVQQDGRGELSTSVERRRIERIEFVGEGEGHYDSLGVYQGVGDYEVLASEATDPSRVQRIDASFRSEVDLSQWPSDGESQAGWRTLRVLHSWTVRAETEQPVGRLWSNLGPILLGRRALSLVDFQMRIDATAWPAARWASPRLRLEERKFVRGEGAAQSLGETDRTRTAALRLRSRPWERWGSDIEPSWEEELHRVEGAQFGETGWRSVSLTWENEVSLATLLTASGRLNARERSRIGDSEEARVYETSPGLIWTPRARSRIELRTTRTSVVRRDAEGRPSRDLEKPGWTSRLLASGEIRDALDLTLWIRENRPDGGRVVQEARLELRATF